MNEIKYTRKLNKTKQSVIVDVCPAVVGAVVLCFFCQFFVSDFMIASQAPSTLTQVYIKTHIRNENDLRPHYRFWNVLHPRSTLKLF